jgi:hypothetical protein
LKESSPDKALQAAKVDGVESVNSQLKVSADGGTDNKNANTGPAKKG